MAIGASTMEGVVALPQACFWRGKRVLITGHTGFKGSWLTLWLARLGADIAGIALAPSTDPNLFTLARVDKAIDNYICDVRAGESITSLVRAVRPEIIFHLAAQPLVRVSYREPVDTIAINVMGTMHLCEAMRCVDSVRVAVFVTTDKVYKNCEWPYPYREQDPLGGHDPYSASKAASELLIDSYQRSFLADHGVAVATARAGNVVGGGDWSDERLIPDAVRSWGNGHPLSVRNPDAIRPWQHVLDPLCGYLRLAELLWDRPELAGAYNFGPETHEAAMVRDVVELARSVYGCGDVVYEGSHDGLHEAGRLTLEVSKIRTVLGMTQRWSLATAIGRTMSWYRRLAEGVEASLLCEEDFLTYEGARL